MERHRKGLKPPEYGRHTTLAKIVGVFEIYLTVNESLSE
jgi:hypothetical protein